MGKKYAWLVVALMAVAVGAITRVPQTFAQNLRRLEYVHANSAQASLQITDCSDQWLTLVTKVRAHQEPDQTEWEAVFHCGPAYTDMAMEIEAPDLERVELALSIEPEAPRLWVLKGDLLSTTDWYAAGSAFETAVRIDPAYGSGWCRVGRALENTNGDPLNATEAYLKCCAFGDPGSNGCYGAGRVMEKSGDFEKAIEYYRLSRWEGSLQRADELEQTLKESLP